MVFSRGTWTANSKLRCFVNQIPISRELGHRAQHLDILAFKSQSYFNSQNFCARSLNLSLFSSFPLILTQISPYSSFTSSRPCNPAQYLSYHIFSYGRRWDYYRPCKKVVSVEFEIINERYIQGHVELLLIHVEIVCFYHKQSRTFWVGVSSSLKTLPNVATIVYFCASSWSYCSYALTDL